MVTRNKFRGQCRCGRFVKPEGGFVMGRRIVCADCGGAALGAEEEERNELAAYHEDRDPIHGFDDAY